MAYTQAQISQAAQLLTTKIKGLTLPAAKVWVTAEQGDNNNVLGVTYYIGKVQHLYTYLSLADGVQAAADLFNRNPAYAAARAAVAATTDPAAQLRAIAASPWNGGHYASSSAFAPYLSGQAVSTAPSPSPASSTPGSSCAARLASLGVSTDPQHKITASEAARIFSAMNPNFRPGNAIYDLGVGEITGMTVQDFCNTPGIDVMPAPVQAVQKAVANFTDWSWVPEVAVNLGILGVGAGLVLYGIKVMLEPAAQAVADNPELLA